MFYLFSILILLLGMVTGGVIYMITPAVPDQFIYLPVVIISFLFLFRGLVEQFEAKLAKWVCLAAILRFVIMLWNVYGRDIFTLPGIGTDTEGFYTSAAAISANLSLLKANLYGAYYSKYLGLVFRSTGPTYLIGSYLNYLYSISSLLVLEKCFSEISSLNTRMKSILLVVFGFLPNGMVIGSSLRRESLMILFIIFSEYEMIRWVRTNDLLYGFKALLCVLLGSILHSGVIGLAAGYIPMLLFYDPSRNTWSARRNSIIAFIIIIVGVSIVVFRYRVLILGKLLVGDEEVFFRRANRAVGDAAYLTNIKIASWVDLVKYLPLKLFYFICAPVPWDWRGPGDMIAFVLDAVVYVYLMKSLLIGVTKMKSAPLLFSIDLGVLACWLIYAIGCQNSANAMRHRLKLLGPMLVVTYLLSLNRIPMRLPRRMR